MILTDLFLIWKCSTEVLKSKNFMVSCLKTLTLLTFPFSSSTAGVQWLQQRNSGPSGAAAERAQCWVAAWELLPGWHYAQAQRLWPQQGDGQVVQTNGRSLLLTPAHLPLPKQQFWLCLFKQKTNKKQRCIQIIWEMQQMLTWKWWSPQLSVHFSTTLSFPSFLLWMNFLPFRSFSNNQQYFTFKSIKPN